MSHLEEHSTKLFWVLGKIPGTFPGERGGFGAICQDGCLHGKIGGIFPGNLPRFQSATVVRRSAIASGSYRLNGLSCPFGIETEKAEVVRVEEAKG